MTPILLLLLVVVTTSSSSAAQDLQHPRKELDSSSFNNIIFPKSSLSLVNLGGRDYFISYDLTTSWYEALQFCDSFGMMLAIVDTSEEKELLSSHFAKTGLTQKWVFVGGNKIGRETYIWLNGAPVIPQPQEPTDFSSGNCIIMWRNDWYQFKCSSTPPAHFICEQNP